VKTVTIEVRGGAVSLIGLPDGVQVVVRDYDIEGCFVENACLDKSGKMFRKTCYYGPIPSQDANRSPSAN